MNYKVTIKSAEEYILVIKQMFDEGANWDGQNLNDPIKENRSYYYEDYGEETIVIVENNRMSCNHYDNLSEEEQDNIYDAISFIEKINEKVNPLVIAHSKCVCCGGNAEIRIEQNAYIINCSKGCGYGEELKNAAIKWKNKYHYEIPQSEEKIPGNPEPPREPEAEATQESETIDRNTQASSTLETAASRIRINLP